MCLSSRMPNPGDHVTDELSGVPAWLRAMQRERYEPFNVCRHRGACAAQGRGSGKKMFVCPYHAWSYDLEGRLRSRGPSDASDISADNGSLVLLPAAEKHGIIWVMTSPWARHRRGRPSSGPRPELASITLETSSHYQTSSLHNR